MFKGIFKGKVVIVGIGNSLCGDDGFGPALIQRLKGKVKAVCLDSGNAPENYTGKIIREAPDTILIADAVHLGLAPGEYAILKKEDILKSGFSTHDISPHLFIEYLKEKTQADIYLLALQPKSVEFGQEMSCEAKQALDEIVKTISEGENNA